MEKKLKELQNEEDRNQMLTYQIGEEVTRFIQGAILKIETTTGMLKCPRLPELLGSFSHRLSEPYKQIVKPQDQRYPEPDQLRYETQLTGVQCYASNNCFNFDFSNGYTTQLKTPSNYDVKLVSIQPPSAKVKRICIWYNEGNGYLDGLQFFDANGNLLLKTLFNFEKFKKKEIILQDDERIIGYVSRKDSEANPCFHYDFQFVIGKHD